MGEYVVKYIGHLNERTRPEGFPIEVHNIGTYKAQNNKELADIINNDLMAFIHQVRGMIVQLDPAQITDMNKLNVSDRHYIPMEQISYIRAEVKLMTPMPTAVDTGIVDARGKEVKEYQLTEGKKILPS